MQDTNTDWSSVDTARDAATQAATTANNFVAGGYTLADELKKAVGERFAQSPIATQAATARSDFMAAAPAARSDVLNMVKGGTILSPTQQNAIIAAKRASALVPVTATNTMQEAAFGTMQDLINAGTNAYNAQTTKLQGAATIAEKSYSDMLNELTTKASIAAQEAQNAKKSTTVWEDSSGNSWLVDTQTGQKLQDLGKAYHASTGGGSEGTWSTFQDASGKVWMLNNKTGEKKLASDTTKNNEQEIADNANSVAAGTMSISQVPMAIRGQVDQLATQIKASQKPWWQFWE
jgi:hypothetical protein